MRTHTRSAYGLTLIQLLVWTTVVMALTFLLYPVFISVQCGWQGATCLANTKQLGVGLGMYVQDWDETYPSAARNDSWGPGPWGVDGHDAMDFHSSSRWVVQLLPYVRDRALFACPSDANRTHNQTNVLVPGSATPFPVSYGPNLLFVNPVAYGWKKRTLTTASVKDPASKYFLADCATPHGFNLDSIAYMRYPNYDPAMRQGGWSPKQYRAAGRVAWPDKIAEPLSRHMLDSNVVFADGHAGWVRHDQIPDNDGRHGEQYSKLLEAMVPWQAGQR